MTPEARRQQLLAAGMELFRQSSYEEISIEDIARHADVSKGLLYHYFPTKRDFLVAAVTRSVEELTELLTYDDSLDPFEQADANIDAFLDYVERCSGSFTTIFRTRGGDDLELAAILADGRARRREFIVEGIARLAELPVADVRTPVLEAAVEGWMFFAEGVMLRWLDRGDIDRQQVHRLMRAALEQVLPIAAAVEPAAVSLTLTNAEEQR
jgi:AcrR family transcriptional regulator